MNKTLEKFGYPAACVFENNAWAVLLRPKQSTLMSLILCNKGEAEAYGDISEEECILQRDCVVRIERVLVGSVGAKKMNYLMLMMKDPHVHFHVIPRYEDATEFGGKEFLDPAWPGAPDLSFQNSVDEAMRSDLLEFLKSEMK